MSDGADTSAAVVDAPVVDAAVAAPPATSAAPEIISAESSPEQEPQEPNNPVPPPVPPPIDASVSQTNSPAPVAPQAPQVAQAVPTPVQPSIKSYLQSALEKIRFKKQAKLDKIVALAQKKGRITNDDVEKLLHVSDSTAQRYLMQLVREGRLKRSGNTISTEYQLA